jgi:RHS repeat-associated protein
MIYDGDGNRVQETAGGTTTKYLVDDNNPTGETQVVEELVGGAVQRTYTYGHALISENQASGVSFYGYDGLGSVRFLTNASGTVTDRYDYDAFGTLMSTSTTPTLNNYRFAGEQNDPNLGLYYLRARYYNAGVGRFWSRDSAGINHTNPRELNRYVYVADNPVNAIDPTGMVAIGEYTLNNSKIEEEGAALRVTGNGVQDVIATETADFNAIEARMIYNNELWMDIPSRARQVTLVRTQVLVNGETREILAVSDFPAPNNPREWLAMREAQERLMLLARQYNWEFVGGNMGGGVHAERYAIDKAIELGIQEGDSLPLGISNPLGPCGPESANCQALITRTIDSGIRVASRYLDMDVDFIGHIINTWP